MGRLENKHRGGLNNEKGARYEEFYATYRIASSLPNYAENHILIKSQIKGAYIDDLKVEIDALHDYFQLKNVQNVKNSWAEIKEDIVSQVKLSLDNKEQFSISIVYSDAEFNVTLSEDIAPYTKLEYFPYANSLLEVIKQHKPFKDVLVDLCVFEKPTDDVIYGLAKFIIAEWCSVNRQKGLLIANLADQLKTSKLNTILDSDRDISAGCQEILDGIPGFSYVIKGKNIVWDIEHSKNNSTEWTQELDDRITHQMPMSAKEIFKML